MMSAKFRRALGILALVLGAALPAAAAIGAGAEKKWFPGQYVMVSPDVYHSEEKPYRVLRGSDGHLFAGLFMYVTWGEIETARGKFAWEKIDRILDALPRGKKFAFSLSWQGWHGAEACPPDMRGNPLYDGGQRVRESRSAGGATRVSGVRFATIHHPATMERYLAFVKAFAERYDADPRLAFVTSAEIPYEQSLHVGLYQEATARQSIFRLVEMIGYFPRTPCGVLGAWWPLAAATGSATALRRPFSRREGASGFPT